MAGGWAVDGAWVVEGAAGVSPPTGVVPGAGCAVVVEAGGVLDGLDWVVDCAHAVAANASAKPANVIAFAAPAWNRPENLGVMTLTSGRTHCARAASLDCLDASIYLFGNAREEYISQRLHLPCVRRGLGRPQRFSWSFPIFAIRVEFTRECGGICCVERYKR